MTKLQKVCFYTFIGLAFLGGLWAYRAFKNQKLPIHKAIQAIPDSCLFFLKLDHFSEVNNQWQSNSLVWQDLKQLSVLQPLQHGFHTLDSLVQIYPDLKKLIDAQSVYITFYKSQQWLLSFNLNQQSQATSLSQWFPVSLKLNTENIYTKTDAGIVAISNASSLIERCLSPSSKKLINNADFLAFYENNHYKGMALYCAPQGTKTWLTHSYSQLHTSPQALFINGTSRPDSSSLLSQLGNGFTPDAEFFKTLPLVCRQFEVFEFANLEKTFQKPLDTWWQAIQDSALFNARQQFFRGLSNQLVVIEMPSQHQAIVIPVADSSLLNDLSPYLYDSLIPRLYPIRRLTSSSRSFIQSTFPNLNCQEVLYACMVNGRYVLTNTIDEADIFINASVQQSSLLVNPSFKAFAREHLQDKLSYLKYILIHQQSKNKLPFNTLLKAKDVTLLKNINHFAYTAKPDPKGLRFRMTLHYYQENSIEEPNLLWTYKADTTINSSCYLFKNHLTRDNELSFQTVDNALYLIRSTGQLIWKKKLNERLQSPIYVVDAFKKNKFQLLFNTANYIHLIDRNGNYVKGYPIKLPAKATNALSLVYYEGKTDERLFIACANNTIYNYSIWGIQQEGFRPFKTDHTVNLPINYCRVGASDYLITADNQGKLYAFSRKGDGRIDFKNKMIEQADEFELVRGNALQNTYILYVDRKNNLINKITLSDKKDVFKVASDKDSIQYTFFDEDRNGISDVMLQTSQELLTYDFNGNVLNRTPLTMDELPKQLRAFQMDETNVYTFSKTASSVVIALDKRSGTKQVFEGTQTPLVSDLFKNGNLYLVTSNGSLLKNYALGK